MTNQKIPTYSSHLMRYYAALAMIATTLVLSSCTKEPTDYSEEFRAIIDRAGTFDDPQTSEEVAEVQETNEVINEEVWNCTTTTYDAMKGGGTGREGFPLFNPNASVIYPGSLLQGKSLKNATPDIIAVERAGGSVSYNLINGNTKSSFSVDKVSKSSIQDAMNQIIASAPQDLPANFSFNYSQVQSRQALALGLGIDFENAFADVSADFDFSTERNYNRILVELKQSFYTMSFDIPTSLEGIFSESVMPQDLERYVQPGNPATYISDVSYGRIYYMLIESTSSYTEMNAAVDAEFRNVTNKVDVDIDASALSELSEVKIKVMAFGGESETTIKTISGDLGELVDLLAESSTISSGLPLSYVVRSVYNNQIVGVQLATRYDVTECTLAPAGGEFIHTAHWKGKVVSAMGGVGAAYCLKGTEFILISYDGLQYMYSHDATLEGPFPIQNLYAGDYPYGADGIGAACNIDGKEGGTIMFMPKSGLYYSYVLDSETWRSNYNNIENLAMGENPFSAVGIGAMVFNDKDSEGPSSRWMFNREGTQYSLYSNSTNRFGDVRNTHLWGKDDTLPFDKVGAGLGFYLGNDKVFLVFDHTGTRYSVSINFGTPLGPFEL